MFILVTERFTDFEGVRAARQVLVNSDHIRLAGPVDDGKLTYVEVHGHVGDLILDMPFDVFMKSLA